MSKTSRLHYSAQRIALAVGLVSILFPATVSAQGGFTGPGRYQITNLKSGKVLDLDRNDQASVIQLSAGRSDSQIWDVQRAGSGFYTLRNVMSGTVLDAVGNRNSTPVRAMRYNGDSRQQWRLEAGTDGNALIVSKLGRSLDIPGGTNREGAKVQTYDGNGESNQRFTFRAASANLNSGDRGGVIPNTAPVSSVNNATGGRTALKPGWNMFSPEQDIELGQQASLEVQQQVQMMNDQRVNSYLNALGRRLAANAPGFQYPYSYKAVNDRSINAFALPGGNIYINRGIIEAADNEAQLAGVMAHETAHVALRHGTNQASKASAANLPLAILGGLLGSESTGAALAQLGAGFTVNSILLRYSRDAESQADLMGTQMLADAGYDPRAMGQFFQKLQAQNPGGSGPAFFNSHPSPERRVEKVNEEAAKLRSSTGLRTNTQEFDQIKRTVLAMGAPSGNQSLQGNQAPAGEGRPDPASSRFKRFENAVLRIDYPENWQPFGQGDAVTVTPRGGMVTDGNGNQALAYGVLVNLYEPHTDRAVQQFQGPGFGQNPAISIETATDQLVSTFQQSNRNMRVVRRHEDISVNGERGLSTYLSNDSPLAGSQRETNWLVTLPHADGLLFLVFTAPEREFQNYEQVFEQMLHSVRDR